MTTQFHSYEDMSSLPISVDMSPLPMSSTTSSMPLSWDTSSLSTSWDASSMPMSLPMNDTSSSVAMLPSIPDMPSVPNYSPQVATSMPSYPFLPTPRFPSGPFKAQRSTPTSALSNNFLNTPNLGLNLPPSPGPSGGQSFTHFPGMSLFKVPAPPGQSTRPQGYKNRKFTRARAMEGPKKTPKPPTKNESPNLVSQEQIQRTHNGPNLVSQEQIPLKREADNATLGKQIKKIKEDMSFLGGKIDQTYKVLQAMLRKFPVINARTNNAIGRDIDGLRDELTKSVHQLIENGKKNSLEQTQIDANLHSKVEKMEKLLLDRLKKLENKPEITSVSSLKTHVQCNMIFSPDSHEVYENPLLESTRISESQKDEDENENGPKKLATTHECDEEWDFKRTKRVLLSPVSSLETHVQCNMIFSPDSHEVYENPLLESTRIPESQKDEDENGLHEYDEEWNFKRTKRVLLPAISIEESLA